MKHTTNTSLRRLQTLLLAFFGDETLYFHSTRLSHFFDSAFADAEFEDEKTSYTPNTPRLLHCHNNLQRLLDAAHQLHQHLPERVSPYRPCVFKQLKHIYPLLNDWDDFPSHLHPHEWCNPEMVIDEFLSFQSIDEWKNVMQCLLEAALGEGSPFTVLSEMQMGFVVIMMHRLLDAVWLMYVLGRIPAADENEEINEGVIISSKTETSGSRITPGFFFIESHGKFQRIDLDKLVCGLWTGNHVQLRTTSGLYQPIMSVEQMIEVLPEARFVWAEEGVVIGRKYFKDISGNCQLQMIT